MSLRFVAVFAGCVPVTTLGPGVDALTPPADHVDVSGGALVDGGGIVGTGAQADVAFSERVALHGSFGIETSDNPSSLTRLTTRVRVTDDGSPVAVAVLAGPSLSTWVGHVDGDGDGVFEPELNTALGGRLGAVVTVPIERWRLGAAFVVGDAWYLPSGNRSATHFVMVANGRVYMSEQIYLAAEGGVLRYFGEGTSFTPGVTLRIGGDVYLRRDGRTARFGTAPEEAGD